MPENKSKDSRRKVLKSIAAGSGAIVAGKSLPESWSRPVVDSVLLPVHAQTSPGCSTEYAGTYEGFAAGTVTRCSDITEPINTPLTIIIGTDCSVSVSYTGIRPYTGTGTLTGRTFSVAVSRTEDCAAGAGGSPGTGTVSGNIDFDGDRIVGDASFGGPCLCGTPVRLDYFGTTDNYTIFKI